MEAPFNIKEPTVLHKTPHKCTDCLGCPIPASKICTCVMQRPQATCLGLARPPPQSAHQTRHSFRRRLTTSVFVPTSPCPRALDQLNHLPTVQRWWLPAPRRLRAFAPSADELDSGRGPGAGAGRGQSSTTNRRAGRSPGWSARGTWAGLPGKGAALAGALVSAASKLPRFTVRVPTPPKRLQAPADPGHWGTEGCTFWVWRGARALGAHLETMRGREPSARYKWESLVPKRGAPHGGASTQHVRPLIPSPHPASLAPRG